MASELEEGDVLRTQDGRTETVAIVETETLDEPVKVYNLEIEDEIIYNDIVERIVSTNAYHYGVKYNGKVYDEYFPNGLEFDSWLQAYISHYRKVTVDTTFIDVF